MIFYLSGLVQVNYFVKHCLSVVIFIRLEELKPLEQAEKEFLEQKHDFNHSTLDESSMQILVVQKAQISRFEKLVTALKSKISAIETQKAKLLVEINGKEHQISTLQDKLVTSEIETECAIGKLKTLQSENAELKQDYFSLEEKHDQLKVMVQTKDDQMKNFIQLVTEIELCVAEIKLLVEFGKAMARGEVPDIASLINHSEIKMGLQLGMSAADLTNQDKSDLSNSEPVSLKLLKDISNENKNIDIEWILERSKKVHELRQDANTLRTLAQDMYNDFLCNEIDVCHLQ